MLEQSLSSKIKREKEKNAHIYIKLIKLKTVLFKTQHEINSSTAVRMIAQYL